MLEGFCEQRAMEWCCYWEETMDKSAFSLSKRDAILIEPRRGLYFSKTKAQTVKGDWSTCHDKITRAIDEGYRDVAIFR